MLDQWAGLELRRLLLVALAVDHIGQQRDKLRTRVAMAVDPRPRLAVRRLALFGSRWRQARQRHAVRTGGGSRRDKIRPWMSTVGCPAGTCNRHHPRAVPYVRVRANAYDSMAMLFGKSASNLDAPRR